MKTKLSKKAIHFGLIFGLLCSVFLSLSRFDAVCEELRQNVLRLHIIANSDSRTDQEIKLKIRDEILKSSKETFETVNSTDEAIYVSKENLEKFNMIANEVLKENGLSYNATAKIGMSYFETREYESFTLPAGNYNSLIITLGEGKGKNWWCVIFPEVCLPLGEKADLEDTVSRKGCEVAMGKDRYIMRFKAVEIYEDIKKLINR